MLENYFYNKNGFASITANGDGGCVPAPVVLNGAKCSAAIIPTTPPTPPSTPPQRSSFQMNQSLPAKCKFFCENCAILLIPYLPSPDDTVKAQPLVKNATTSHRRSHFSLKHNMAPGLAEPSAGTGSSVAADESLVYDRDRLMSFSRTDRSLACPKDWKNICYRFPDIMPKKCPW